MSLLFRGGGLNTPFRDGPLGLFDQWHSSRSTLSCRILQLVPLEGMAELVVAKIQRCGRRTLIEAIATERLLEDLAFVVGHGRAEIVRARRGSLAGRRNACRGRLFTIVGRGGSRLGQNNTSRRRRPGRMKRIEDDLVHRTLSIFVPIDGPLDHIPQFANVSWPSIVFKLG